MKTIYAQIQISDRLPTKVDSYGVILNGHLMTIYFNGRRFEVYEHQEGLITHWLEKQDVNETSGVELITAERKEQIEKHGFDVENDTYYSNGQLKKAALYCLTLKESYYPKGWADWFRKKIAAKTLRLKPVDFDIQMLRIAGAFCAAEIDRLQNK